MWCSLVLIVAVQGRVIFSLSDLEIGKLWWSEQGNAILRRTPDEILLGGAVSSALHILTPRQTPSPSLL